MEASVTCRERASVWTLHDFCCAWKQFTAWWITLKLTGGQGHAPNFGLLMGVDLFASLKKWCVVLVSILLGYCHLVCLLFLLWAICVLVLVYFGLFWWCRVIRYNSCNKMVRSDRSIGSRTKKTLDPWKVLGTLWIQWLMAKTVVLQLLYPNFLH